MPILEEKVREQVREMFKELKKPVKLIVFTQGELIKVPGIECEKCKDNRILMEEVASLSDKVSVEVYDFVKDTKEVAEYKVDKIPVTIVRDEKDYGIRLYGMPAGYEFPTLLGAIQMISTGTSGLSDETKSKLKAISKPAHIQVFVTLTCPYCSSAVAMGHRMAYESDKIAADMVNAQEFPQLAQRYNVFAVPKVVINETTQYEGALPEDKFLENVLKSTESVTEE